MKNTHAYINSSVSKRKPGELIFPRDFRGKGTEGAIKMSLGRLVKEGLLKRLGHGIYYIPKIDQDFGELYPAPDKVAQAIAKKEKVKIRPTGAYALNQLGLSTQVPMRMVYITDGENRRIKIGKMEIRFKATTPKRLALKGPLSSLIILGLEDMGVENISEKNKLRIRELLQKEDPVKLKRDLALAPARIHDFLFHLITDPI